MKNVEQVESLDGLQCGVVYKTVNYDLLKDTDGNRAGLSSRRVKKFEKLIKEGKFINEVSIVMVNKKGKKIDGHHRSKAVENQGLPVYFIMTDSKEFNGNDTNKILNNIARINSSINPAWSKEDHIKSAITSEVPLALKLDEIRKELIEKFNLDSKNISTNDLYGILKKNIKSYGKKVTRAELEDLKLLDEVESERFNDDVMFYARLMMYFKNSPIRSYKAVKEIFREMWMGEIQFNRNRFYDNMIKKGYAPKDDSVEEHRRVIRKLASSTRRGRAPKPDKLEKLKSLEVA